MSDRNGQPPWFAEFRPKPSWCWLLGPNPWLGLVCLRLTKRGRRSRTVRCETRGTRRCGVRGRRPTQPGPRTGEGCRTGECTRQPCRQRQLPRPRAQHATPTGTAASQSVTHDWNELGLEVGRRGLLDNRSLGARERERRKRQAKHNQLQSQQTENQTIQPLPHSPNQSHHHLTTPPARSAGRAEELERRSVWQAGFGWKRAGPIGCLGAAHHINGVAYLGLGGSSGEGLGLLGSRTETGTEHGGGDGDEGGGGESGASGRFLQLSGRGSRPPSSASAGPRGARPPGPIPRSTSHSRQGATNRHASDQTIACQGPAPTQFRELGGRKPNLAVRCLVKSTVRNSAMLKCHFFLPCPEPRSVGALASSRATRLASAARSAQRATHDSPPSRHPSLGEAFVLLGRICTTRVFYAPHASPGPPHETPVSSIWAMLQGA